MAEETVKKRIGEIIPYCRRRLLIFTRDRLCARSLSPELRERASSDSFQPPKTSVRAAAQ